MNIYEDISYTAQMGEFDIDKISNLESDTSHSLPHFSSAVFSVYNKRATCLMGS